MISEVNIENHKYYKNVGVPISYFEDSCKRLIIPFLDKQHHYNRKIPEIEFLIKSSPQSNYSLIDIGCGCGYIYLQIKNTYPNIKYIGLDIPIGIDHITQYLPKENFRYCDINNFEYDDIKPFYPNILYIDGVFVMINDSDDIINKILSFGVKYVVIKRHYMNDSGDHKLPYRISRKTFEQIYIDNNYIIKSIDSSTKNIYNIILERISSDINLKLHKYKMADLIKDIPLNHDRPTTQLVRQNVDQYRAEKRKCQR